MVDDAVLVYVDVEAVVPVGVYAAVGVSAYFVVVYDGDADVFNYDVACDECVVDVAVEVEVCVGVIRPVWFDVVVEAFSHMSFTK